MCRGAFSVVVLVAFFGMSPPVLAHKATASSMATSPVVTHNRSSRFEDLNTDKTARSKTVLTPGSNPASSPIIPSTYRDMDRATPNAALDTATGQTPRIDSKWRFIASLLGTMAIIVTIAVRRRKPGKPWA